MGNLLDSSISIGAERASFTPEQLLAQLRTRLGETELAFSAVGVTELLHGVYRDRDASRRRRRHTFFEQLFREIPIFPYTEEISRLAGRVGGEQAAAGRTLPPVDLMIGATALFHGYSVVTTNLRHFREIPGLQVIAF